MGPVDALLEGADDFAAGGIREPSQLLQVLVGETPVQIPGVSPHEDRPVHWSVQVDELGRNPTPPWETVR